MFGGFVYFDHAYNIEHINSIGMADSGSGPVLNCKFVSDIKCAEQNATDIILY
jgi:hypothetical protein